MHCKRVSYLLATATGLSLVSYANWCYNEKANYRSIHIENKKPRSRRT